MSELLRRVRPRSRLDLLLWSPVAFAAADLVVMLVDGPEMVRALYHNADVAGAGMIGLLFAERGTDSTVVLGSHPWYESFWFMRATDWLPAERGIWILGPFVFSGLAIAGLSWTAWRLFGAWAGAMVAVLLVCSSSALRIVMFTLNWHGGTLVHAVVLCMVLVVITRRARRLSAPALAALGLVVAAVTALVVPDRLALATAIGPFVGAALIMWWRTGLPAQRRVAVFALATMAAAGFVGELAAYAMEESGVIGIPSFEIRFNDYTRLADTFEIFVVAFTALGGGIFFDRELGAGPLAHLAAAGLTLAAGVLVLRRLWAAMPGLARRAAVTDPATMAREAYVVFWSLALLAVLTAFFVTDVSYDIASSRYLSGAFLALAALVPAVLVDSSRARVLAAAGIALYAALSLGYHVTKGSGTWSTAGDLYESTKQVEEYARANGLEFGYAGYDEAPVMTWFADARIKVFPVRECGARLCQYGAHTISSWYRPRPGVRSFLVTHPSARGPSLRRPYAAAGEPVETRRFGSLTVYVYDHDLAADLAPVTAAVAP